MTTEERTQLSWVGVELERLDADICGLKQRLADEGAAARAQLKQYGEQLREQGERCATANELQVYLDEFQVRLDALDARLEVLEQMSSFDARLQLVETAVQQISKQEDDQEN